ncbi:MAG TPA: hypothetical protein VNE86_02495 [Nitrososphaerales archaeon]|nr:hypothetical protein [Nitrososphaerales archaeon]
MDDDQRDYRSFNVRHTIDISGKVFARNQDRAESDFRKDVLQTLRTSGYSAEIVPNPDRTKT